jgi:Flp pilus assembly protein TadG
MITKRRKERGAALIESAITIPIILLISVAIFEFGRAFQTWQVLTNAAREGARVSIIAGKNDADVEGAVRKYLEVGGLPKYASDTVQIKRQNVTIGVNEASRIEVTYPFEFIVLSGVMKLVSSGSDQSNALTMGAVAIMRNEN